MQKLTTQALIAKYDSLMAKGFKLYSTDGNDLSRSQKTINKIVDELAERDDPEAEAFFNIH